MTPSDGSVYIVIPAYKPVAALLPLIKRTRDLLAEYGARVVLVDDGSGPGFREIFEQAENLGNVTVLRHAVNLGKGAALKTAFNHILLQPGVSGAVTMDADGQHLPQDVLAVAREMAARPHDLILGCRAFQGQVPWRSRCGNFLTRTVCRFLIGRNISDTQTGLRGLPRAFMAEVMRLRTCGYDFEMEMLCLAVSKVNITEVPISTVYLDSANSNSHFNYLLDSVAIYTVLLRHLGNSVSSAAIDFVIFGLIWVLSGSILVSLVAGRVVSVIFNFQVSKRYVFRSNGAAGWEMRRYLTLAGLLALASYIGIRALAELGLGVMAAKLIVEGTLFLISFSVQRSHIFAHQKDAGREYPL